PLVAVGQAKEQRRDQHDDPSPEPSARQGSHDKSAIEKLFAKPRGRGEREVRKQLQRGLRQNALGTRLHPSAGAGRNGPDTATAQPLKATHYCRAHKPAEESPGSAV